MPNINHFKGASHSFPELSFALLHSRCVDASRGPIHGETNPCTE
jgi:hypothetical protein